MLSVWLNLLQLLEQQPGFAHLQPRPGPQLPQGAMRACLQGLGFRGKAELQLAVQSLRASSQCSELRTWTLGPRTSFSGLRQGILQHSQGHVDLGTAALPVFAQTPRAHRARLGQLAGCLRLPLHVAAALEEGDHIHGGFDAGRLLPPAQMSHNQNPVLRWSTQNYVKN